MFEKPINNESGAEKIPTEKEVYDVFERLTQGQKYKEVRKLVDEKGVFLWEISIQKGNEVWEYSYGRANTLKCIETTVHVTFFDRDGMPIGGESVAKFVDGNWEFQA